MRIEIAKKVAEHLHKMPDGFPTGPCNDEYMVLDHSVPMSDEEGELICQLMAYGEHIDDMADRLARKKEELIPLLDGLIRKGWVGRQGTKDDGYYRLLSIAPGWIEARWLQHRNRNPDFIPYEMSHMTEESFLSCVLGTKPDTLPAYRVLPHEAAMPHDTEVLPGELLSHIIEHVGDEGIGVMDCFCRTWSKLGGPQPLFTPSEQSCDRPRDSMCLVFGYQATTIIEAGVGRAITKDEAAKIARRGRDAGLVHHACTSEHVVSICQCCPCCCILMRLHLSGAPTAILKSNFTAVTNDEACIGCKRCVAVCPTKALSFNRKTKKAVLDAPKCIGCGLCVVNCHTEGAMTLKRKPRDEVVTYPHTKDDYLLIRGQQEGRTELVQMK